MSATNSPHVDTNDVQKRSPWYALRGADGSESSRMTRVQLVPTLATASTPPSYAADPKYKKYTQQVEKCLSINVQEWADFISFLKQLLKVRVPWITVCYCRSLQGS